MEKTTWKGEDGEARNWWKGEAWSPDWWGEKTSKQWSTLEKLEIQKLHGDSMAHQLDGVGYWKAISIHSNRKRSVGCYLWQLFGYGEFISNIWIED